MIHLRDINKTYFGAQPLHVLKGNHFKELFVHFYGTVMQLQLFFTVTIIFSWYFFFRLLYFA